jgi:hypothetical protein
LTPQRAIFTETLRDAPILPARFVAALARCLRIALRAAPAGSGKIGSVAAMTTIETGS